MLGGGVAKEYYFSLTVSLFLHILAQEKEFIAQR